MGSFYANQCPQEASGTGDCRGEMMLSDLRQPELPEWLRELYPFQTRTLQLGPQRMSFVDEGAPEAPPLVLLHGNPTWSFLYRDLIARARPHYHVIAPDQVGFGLSDKPADPGYHTLAQHISNLTELIEALGLRHITLVMNGWGGPIGMGYAVRHPQNLERLVLASAWASKLARVRAPKYPLGVRIAASGRLGAWLDSRLNLSLQSLFSSRMYRPLRDLALEAYAYPFQGGAESLALRVAVHEFTRMFFEPDAETCRRLDEIHSGLSAISAPATILWGARDPVLSKLPAYVLRDQLKRAAEPRFVADVGHYLPEEDPDAMATAVLEPTHMISAAPSEAARPENVFKIIG